MTELCEQVNAWAEATPQVPVQVWCATMQLPRGSYYAWRRRQLKPSDNRPRAAVGRAPVGYSTTHTGQVVSDDHIMAWIWAILEQENPWYGYRKITAVLRQQYGLIINPKKVYRLMKAWHLLWPDRPPKSRYPRKLARNWVITRPNQLWQTDITYGYIAGEDRFFYVQAILDVCDRSIVAYHIGLTCRAADAAQTLQRAVQARQAEWGPEPPVIRTDNGPQFTAHVFEAQCETLGLTHERIPVATPNANAYIEAWHALLDRECLSQEFETYAEAYSAVSQWIALYNQRRLHSALGYRSPVQMRHAVASGQAQWTPLCA